MSSDCGNGRVRAKNERWRKVRCRRRPGALAILAITATPVMHCGIHTFSQEIQLAIATPVAGTQIRSFPGRVPVVVAPAPSTNQKVSPVLHARLHSRDSATINFIVELREQVDFNKLANIFAENHVSRATRKAWTKEALTQIAHRSQRSLNRILEADKHKGNVESWSNLAVANAIVVRGRPAILPELASRPEIASLTEEIEGGGSPELVQEGAEERPSERNPLWPLEMLKAEAAFDVEAVAELERAVALSSPGMMPLAPCSQSLLNSYYGDRFQIALPPIPSTA